ncbi:SDR family oxidoreductase [Aliidiomarina halalkaliphila]|uniref:SDR family oxidoreductase n=1 Tax=Aliidiomarina halalkaliphila TaxID=2593535 RepID=A0A552X4K7_9GAMM|nr:SDR family oxidoreductase [Aliidiomarina halalkaliphila]TRW49533.1 SDR family oxidoreductase [Aliidiomarina halalkaliphila]
MRKTIIITGASSGLGAEMARQFAALGRNLGLCARRTERLETLKQELETQYPSIKVSLKALDVNDHDAVFRVFGEFKQEFGHIDRIIVNAGMGKGGPLGTGLFKYNKLTAETNYIAALAQCEAALEIFYEQQSGHLVTIASISALRGMPRALTAYASSKAALVNLTEGIRADLMRQNSPIKTSCILPGFIRSEINEKVKNTPFMCDTVPGVRSMVRAIEKEKVQAYVPSWPWILVAFLLKRLPLKQTLKLG